jgi:hypothetical protein
LLVLLSRGQAAAMRALELELELELVNQASASLT